MSRFPFAIAPFKIEGASTGYDGYSGPSDEAVGSDDIVLSTGKRLYANGGILGIDGDGGVFEGYDGGLRTGDLSPDERKEIAAMAIERWQKWGGI